MRADQRQLVRPLQAVDRAYRRSELRSLFRQSMRRRVYACVTMHSCPGQWVQCGKESAQSLAVPDCRVKCLAVASQSVGRQKTGFQSGTARTENVWWGVAQSDEFSESPDRTTGP